MVKGSMRLPTAGSPHGGQVRLRNVTAGVSIDEITVQSATGNSSSYPFTLIALVAVGAAGTYSFAVDLSRVAGTSTHTVQIAEGKIVAMVR